MKNRALELFIRHQSRQHDAPEQAPGDKYGDILAAFHIVDRAALLGAPGSGKSTTLRKLALASPAKLWPTLPRHFRFWSI